MSETEPTAQQPTAQPTAQQPSEAPAPPGPRWRDRVFGLRALLAVTLAGVILGGLAGFGISAATDGEGRDGRMGRFGPGFGPGGHRGHGGPGGFPQGPGGQPPGLPDQQPQTPLPSQTPSQDS